MPPAAFEEDTISFVSCDTIDTFETEAEENYNDVVSLLDEDEDDEEDEILVSNYDMDDNFSGVAILMDDTNFTDDEDDDEDTDDDDDDDDDMDPELCAVNDPPPVTTCPTTPCRMARTSFREGVNNLTDVSPKRPRRSWTVSPPLVTPDNDDEDDNDLTAVTMFLPLEEEVMGRTSSSMHCRTTGSTTCNETWTQTQNNNSSISPYPKLTSLQPQEGHHHNTKPYWLAQRRSFPLLSSSSKSFSFIVATSTLPSLQQCKNHQWGYSLATTRSFTTRGK